jgi:hypothetical protein
MLAAKLARVSDFRAQVTHLANRHFCADSADKAQPICRAIV